MELRQVRYFVTVAHELHFGRAAERLHIVQSAVSQQVRRLERELGAELFDRSARQVRLTAVGARFLPEAQALLAAEERARAVVAELTAGRSRTLRLGTSTGLGAHLDRVLDALAGLPRRSGWSWFRRGPRSGSTGWSRASWPRRSFAVSRTTAAGRG
ncbi:LysR family transcriptional regulator [Streptomyces sp. NPDC001633]|uniref:LysR family transcriptional regulator n=1 Tax=Streptomyces sp. NPDC001633 TaxID=3364595 RepID=UPI00367CCF55